MRIIFPHADYNTAFCSAGLGPLADRRNAICAKFISKARTSPPLSYILTNWFTINHGYQLLNAMMKLMPIITGQSHYCQISTEFLRKLCIKE